MQLGPVILLSLAVVGALIGWGFILLRRDVARRVPEIDWTMPNVEEFASELPRLPIPNWRERRKAGRVRIIGTSGAWQDVARMLEPYPLFRQAPSASALKERVTALDANLERLVQESVVTSTVAVLSLETKFQARLHELRTASTELEANIRPKLNEMYSYMTQLSSGPLNRLKVSWLTDEYCRINEEFVRYRETAQTRTKQQEDRIAELRDPGYRERTIRRNVQQEIDGVKGAIGSKEFAGAVAELAVIEELEHLPPDCVIINDVRIKADRYIHFGGHPIQSAQIDSLVVSPAGVFVIEVKNWSRQFAESGEGFNPYDQVERAAYLVFDRLRSADLRTRVQGIVTALGSLPDRGSKKVFSVSIHNLRRFILKARPAGVMVERIAGEICRMAGLNNSP